MEWVASGIWGDQGMPEVEELETALFGTRTSPIIDVAEATERLGIIRTGKVEIITNFPKYSFLEVSYSLNAGKDFAPPIALIGTNEFALSGVKNDMQIVIRTNLRSPISDILRLDRLEIHKITITLSNKPIMLWDGSEKTVLEWEV